MLEFRNIGKRFGSNVVLHDINFTVDKSEVVVLIGASGCGKTTCLKMINRLISPSEGQILIDGKDIQESDPIELRRNMGYVIQQTGLFPHMTIRENIEIIPQLEKRDPAAIAQRTTELMRMVGLGPEKFLYRYPSQLSGGQQQRIGVARAFATDPDIILMDEPFSALDPITRSQLQDELVELQQKLKKSIIFVTHDMDEAVKLADRICIMDKGEIVQFDTPENILKRPANEFVRNFVGRKRIWSQPELIRAEDIMIPNPVTATMDMTVLRAAQRMRLRNVDSLMVVDNDHRLQGVFRLSDLHPGMSGQDPITSLMSAAPVTAHPGDSIISMLTVLNRDSLPSLPVVDDNGVLVGLITKSSLVSTLSQQFIDVNENTAAEPEQPAAAAEPAAVTEGGEK